MNNILLKTWFSAVLSILSTLLPTWTMQEKVIVPAPLVVAATKVSTNIPSPQIHSKPAAQAPKQTPPSFLCSFSGKATFEGQPFQNAKLLLWVTTPSGQEMHELQTAQDGSYALNLPVNIGVNEPIDWEIKWNTPDFKTVDRVGRRIALVGESMVAIQTPLEFSIR